MDMQATLGKRGRQLMQRHIRVAFDFTQHEHPMPAADQIRPVAAHLAGRHAAQTALARRHLITLETATFNVAATS
jgi:hypothetical protein